MSDRRDDRLVEALQHISSADAACAELDFPKALSHTRLASAHLLPAGDDPVAAELLTYALTIEADVHRHLNEGVAAELTASVARAIAEESVPGSGAAAVAILSDLTCQELFGDPRRAAEQLVVFERDLRDVTRWNSAPARLQALDHVLSCAKRIGDWSFAHYAIKAGHELAEDLAEHHPDVAASFWQWRGFAESSLGDLDRACAALELSLAYRARNRRRDATRPLVEAELAIAGGDLETGRALFLGALEGLLALGMLRHHASVTAMLKRRRIIT